MINSSYDYIEQLWKSRETLISILKRQKYDVEEYSITLDEFKEWAGNDDIRTIKDALTLILTKELPKQDKLLIMWLGDGKLGENLQMILSKMNYEGCSRSIIIVDVGVTPSAKSLIRNLARKKIFVEVSTMIEMQFSVLDHEYVPLHELCNNTIKNNVLKAYGIKTSQMPEIKFYDPAIKHLGATKGQLVKITRDSETQPGYKSITYRVVV